MKTQLVSIIIAAYNAQNFIQEAISSVLEQSYENIEILIVDDGSTDATLEEVKKFKDQRLHVLSKSNGGVSSARNAALKIMKGDLFCFLDADDVMPSEAIKSRVDVFDNNPYIDFVDGMVEYVDKNLVPLERHYVPEFTGNPLPKLLRLDRSCLFGNTWMIRKRDGIKYQFNESLTHAEDLYFYLTICNQYATNYSFTNTPILKYRQHDTSSMKNLRGLENGYSTLLKEIKSNITHTKKQFWHLKFRVIRIMLLSHLVDGRDPLSAIRVLLTFPWI